MDRLKLIRMLEKRISELEEKYEQEYTKSRKRFLRSLLQTNIHMLEMLLDKRLEDYSKSNYKYM